MRTLSSDSPSDSMGHFGERESRLLSALNAGLRKLMCQCKLDYELVDTYGREGM